MDAGASFGGAAAETTPMSAARRYTLLRRLAVGGMGELFLARAAAPGGVQKLVAIKRVRPEYASDTTFVTMFLNEARLAATLDHPNIVRTYDLVEDEGSFFMVMEYLHGEPLGRLLNAVSSKQERVPLQHVLTIGLGVAAGLHSAHERRAVDGRSLDIVHRDLSPGNVFITYDGSVKLLDFGIAKATSRTSITIGPSRKGKVAYMSPEQCVGDDVDRRSDIFALGVVLWELCTASRLFRGDNEFGIMNQITTIDAPAASDVPDELAAILDKALARDRDARFQTAMQLHDALEAFAKAHGIMPSVPALGRFLEEVCGRRDLPSSEPSEEFMRGATIVSDRDGVKPTTSPKRRSWSLVLALAGGATLGAIAVGAATRSGAATPEPPPPVQDRATPQVRSPAGMAVVPERVAQPSLDSEPEPEPQPAAEVAAAAPEQPPAPAEAEAEPEPESQPARRAKHHFRQRGSKRKKKPADGAKPDSPRRGVDGLLPRG
jgi:serine/threonine protein kinase